jgi:uncharacterized membrane protein YvbJ
MKYCPDCGTKLVEDASFCQECGRNLEQDTEDTDSENMLNTEEEIREAAREAVERYGMTIDHINEEVMIHYFLMDEVINKQAEEEVEEQLNIELD